MKNINGIKNQLWLDLKDNKISDLSDIGNIIGLVIGEYIDDNKMGFGKDDFLHGLNHGFSLINETH
jgi:hypothetical protein